MALFDELHAKGNTIILVTHEPDIAEYAHRVVHIRDGVIASDAVSSPGPHGQGLTGSTLFLPRR